MNVRRVLVPLDGSRLAETALPPAQSLASVLGARLMLLHVVEEQAPASVHGEAHLLDAADAASYLDALAARLRASRVEVATHVHERPVTDVAAALDGHTHELDADLIAMCAHGRTNLRERALGTIAERILRGGSVPILLRTVRRPSADAFALRTLLVALDFGHDVELALDAARALARPYGAAITLLTAPEGAAPPVRRLLPGASALAREYEGAEAEGRVGRLVQRLRGERLEATGIVADEEPCAAIVSASRALPADLVVLVTDAHGGLSSWYDPSTLQRLLAVPDLTLLLIREV